MVTPPAATPDWVAIGTLGAPHGVHGEIKLFPLSDVPGRFRIPEKEGSPGLREVRWSGEGKADKRLKVASIRPGKRFFLIAFEGIANPEDASGLIGGVLSIPRSERGRLPKDSFFLDDILGLTAVDEQGQVLGRVAEIYQTGANDVYEIRGNRGEWLVPALKKYVLEIDLESRRMVGRLPEMSE